jgi:hypothetical protein
MSDLRANATTNSWRTPLLVWAITATLAAVVFAIVALLLFVRLRTLASPTGAAPSPFLTLQESDVIGRYRFFEGTNDMGFIELLPTHSIINKDGTTYPQYRWEILRDGLLTVWQKSTVTFKHIEKPGVYVAHRDDGTLYRRIEKVEQQP